MRRRRSTVPPNGLERDVVIFTAVLARTPVEDQVITEPLKREAYLV
jgi:hypothetical protein